MAGPASDVRRRPSGYRRPPTPKVGGAPSFAQGHPPSPYDIRSVRMTADQVIRRAVMCP